jgi:hypothetical protein
MFKNEEQARLAGKLDAKMPGLLGRLLATAAGAIALIGILIFSVLAFIAIAATGLVIAGYLWWRTRELRKRMREHPPGGHIIEGEVIGEPETRDPVQR